MSEKLESVRKRIEEINKFLETATPGVTSISGPDMSMSIDRAGLLEELKSLEAEEARLTKGSRWIRKVDMTGT